jgi:hypothetical protein
MKTNRRMARTLISTGLLGAALAFGALTATPADANHGNGRGHGRGHKTVVVHRTYYPAPVVVRRVVYPRPVYVRPAPVYVRTYHPWYYGTNRIYVNSSPFYFNAGLSVFFGGANLNLQFSNYAPAGYVYVDPYCNEDFYSVSEYREHLRYEHHPAALQCVYVGDHDDDDSNYDNYDN